MVTFDAIFQFYILKQVPISFISYEENAATQFCCEDYKKYCVDYKTSPDFSLALCRAVNGMKE